LQTHNPKQPWPSTLSARLLFHGENKWLHRIPRFQLRRRPRRIKFPIGRPTPALDPGFTREADLDFLDHIHREEFDQPDLPWES
jgi:hypothetical protein